MKQLTKVLTAVFALAVMVFFAAPLTAQSQEHGNNFVDANGDGYNDNAPDHDGDGIPNGQEKDWQKPQDGSGATPGRGVKKRGNGFKQDDSKSDDNLSGRGQGQKGKKGSSKSGSGNCPE